MSRKAFEPVGDIGDVVLLLNGAEGPIKNSPFRQIAFYEKIRNYGVHSLVCIWRDSVDIDPYALDDGGYTGHILADSTTPKIIPASLRFPDGNTDGLAQFRFRLRPVSLTGIAAQDFDVALYHPQGLQRFQLQTQGVAAGVLNMVSQWPDPGDVESAQLEGAAITVPSPGAFRDPWEDADELFVIGNQGPAFTISNTGDSDTSAGMLGLETRVIRYVLNPLDVTNGTDVAFLDGKVTVPPGVDWNAVKKITISGSAR